MLSEAEFAKSIYQGHGRAYLHVLEHGVGDYEHILLNACEKFYGYDRQCEESRAQWLFAIIRLTCHESLYEDHILRVIQSTTDHADQTAMVQLLKCFAATGSQRARDAIYSAFDASRASDDSVGDSEIVDLDGIEGFLYIAEAKGEIFRSDPEAWDTDLLVEMLEQAQGTEKVKNALDERALQSQNVRAYLDRISEIDENEVPPYKPYPQRMLDEFPLPRILSDAHAMVGNYPGRYAKFGKYASEDDIQLVYRDLLLEENEEVIVRLLWVFRVRELPEIDEKLLRWVRSENAELSAAAISALSQMSDEVVHAIAVEILSDPSWQRAIQGLELLRRNYQPEDAQLLASALRKVPESAEPYELHYPLLDLISLAEDTKSVELVNAVLWAYENNPCSLCRRLAVVWLHEMNSIPKATMEECLCDAVEDTRLLAETEMGVESPIRLANESPLGI